MTSESDAMVDMDCCDELGSHDYSEERRMIRLFGEVNNEMDFTIWSALRELATEDPVAPITLFLNSPGGSMTSMFSIIDAIQLCEAPVQIIGTGQIMSAAVPILAAGTPGYRFLAPRTRLMLHPPSVILGGIQRNAENAHKESKVKAKMMKDVLIETTKMNKEIVEHYIDKMEDRYFSATQAVRLGIADGVLRRMP